MSTNMEREKVLETYKGKLDCLSKKYKLKCPDCLEEYDAPLDVMFREILDCPKCSLQVEVTKIGGNEIEYGKLYFEGEDGGE